MDIKGMADEERVQSIKKTAIKKFEDLVAWQKARILTRTVYDVTCGKEFSRDYGPRDQLRRSAVSTMSNLAEDFERGGQSEFHQFLSVSKGPCAELRSQLYVAFDAGYIDQRAFERLLLMAEEVARIIGGLRLAVQKQRDKSKLEARGQKLRASEPQSSALSPQS